MSDFQLVMEFYPSGTNLFMRKRPNIIFKQPNWEQAEQNHKQKTTNMSPDQGTAHLPLFVLCDLLTCSPIRASKRTESLNFF